MDIHPRVLYTKSNLPARTFSTWYMRLICQHMAEISGGWKLRWSSVHPVVAVMHACVFCKIWSNESPLEELARSFRIQSLKKVQNSTVLIWIAGIFGQNLSGGESFFWIINDGFTNLWEGWLSKYAARRRSLWHTWSDSPLFCPSLGPFFARLQKRSAAAARRTSRRYEKDSAIGAAKNGACWPLGMSATVPAR